MGTVSSTSPSSSSSSCFAIGWPALSVPGLALPSGRVLLCHQNGDPDSAFTSHRSLFLGGRPSVWSRGCLRAVGAIWDVVDGAAFGVDAVILLRGVRGSPRTSGDAHRSRFRNMLLLTLYSSNAWFQESTSAESSQISSWVAAVPNSIVIGFGF